VNIKIRNQRSDRQLVQALLVIGHNNLVIKKLQLLIFLRTKAAFLRKFIQSTVYVTELLLCNNWIIGQPMII